MQDIEHLGDARLPHSAQAIQKGAPDQAALGTQCRSLEDILAGTNTTVEPDFGLMADRVYNRR